MAGCPFLFGPPFDVTGIYTGDFTVGEDNVTNGSIFMECPLELDLMQEASAVSGTVAMDFECIAGGQLLADLDLLPQQLFDLDPIDINGAVLPNGNVTFASDGLLNECEEEFCISVAFSGEGADTDGDGMMDVIMGTWVGTIQVDMQTLPLIGEFGAEFAS